MRDPGQVGVPRGARQRPAVIGRYRVGSRFRSAPSAARKGSCVFARFASVRRARDFARGSSRFVSQGRRRSRGRGSRGAADAVILPARKRGSLRLFREPPANAASINVAPGRRFVRFKIEPEPSRELPVCKSVAVPFTCPAPERLSACSRVDEPDVGWRRLRRPKRNGRPG